MAAKVMAAKEMWRRYKRKRAEMEIGLRIRNGIHLVGQKLHPYAKVIFPNFRVVHYFYIISMVILGSILVYPVRNERYIDVLFLMTGACTQAGLNTVDLNKFELYQQIIVYIITVLTTPIFIHGSLLFVRLYWFERHFDNIKERSKLNFKMRRSATLAARTQSHDATQANTLVNQGLGNNPSNQRETVRARLERYNFSNPDQDSSPDMARDEEKYSTQVADANVEHISEPSESDEENSRAIKFKDRASADSRGGGNNIRPINVSRSLEGIRFGALPQPSKIRNKEVEPSDMYKSIAMLQNHHQEGLGNAAEEDDILIIKSPNEIEKDSQNPIFTKKAQIQFDFNKDPIKGWKHKRGISKGSQSWSKLKRSFSNTQANTKTREVSASLISNYQGDDGSIDSEQSREVGGSYNESDPDYEDDDDADTENSSNGNDESISSDDHYQDKDEEMESKTDIERAQSNLEIPSTDATGGRKFGKRSNTLEVVTGNEGEFSRSPTFDRLIKSKLHDRHGRKRKRDRLRHIKTPMSKLNTSSLTNEISLLNVTRSDTDGSRIRRVTSATYLSWNPTIGRNSNFVHMTEQQKEELGGVEYRAVKLLIKILLAYYIGFHVLAVTFLLPYILHVKKYADVVRLIAISPTWWGFFTAQSAFNDLGFTLTPDSMLSFSESAFVLIVMSFFIVIGNTGFPVMLRFIIWIMFKLARPLSLLKESLGFLLDHPRRCFTLLFPSVPTWWLFSILIILNAVDWILFIILDLNNHNLKDISTGYRVVDGLFQAFSTRTAGFSCLDLSQLHAAIQVSYMIMMYISVLPLAISIRRTNVYEEQSLGVYIPKNDENAIDEKTPKSFVGAHLRHQLSFDLWFIFLGLFIICVAEGNKVNSDVRFTSFAILFEIISAYGCVGLSLGYPNVNASFSSQFSTISKLVMVAMMIRGRHRGLPYALDRAIMLPDDQMHKRDIAQERNDLRRSTTIDTANNDTNLLRAFTRRGSRFGLSRPVTNRSSQPNASIDETINRLIFSSPSSSQRRDSRMS